MQSLQSLVSTFGVGHHSRQAASDFDCISPVRWNSISNSLSPIDDFVYGETERTEVVSFGDTARDVRKIDEIEGFGL